MKVAARGRLSVLTLTAERGFTLTSLTAGAHSVFELSGLRQEAGSHARAHELRFPLFFLPVADTRMWQGEGHLYGQWAGWLIAWLMLTPGTVQPQYRWDRVVLDRNRGFSEMGPGAVRIV